MVKFYEDFIQRPAWRGGVTDCPHCNHRMEGWHWEKYEYVREIITGLHIPYWKPGAVFVVSECPKCFKLSWNHLDLTMLCSYERLCGWPKEEFRKLRKEYDRRMNNGWARYRRSQCSKCAHGKEPRYTYLYPLMECQGSRSNHTRLKRDKCKGFKEIK
jgi:hypothetical protein